MLQKVDAEATGGRQSDQIPFFSVKSEVHDPGIHPIHSHDHFEVLFLLSGARIQHIESTNVAAEEGHLLFLPPGVKHGATRKTKNQTLVIAFNLSFLHPELPLEAMRAWDRPAALEAAPEILPFVAQSKVEFSCRAKLAGTLREMATDLLVNSTLPALGARAHARSQLSLLLLQVVRSFEHQIVDAAHDHRPAPNSNFFDELTAFIQANLAEPLSIEDAARELSVSPSCLSSRVRRTIGASFSELLANARLKKARELLVFTDSRISEIAYACGFEDNAYFSRRFRQVTGMTPGDYRQRVKSTDFHQDRNDTNQDINPASKVRSEYLSREEDT